jgi:hypothetical protein
MPEQAMGLAFELEEDEKKREEEQEEEFAWRK